MNKSIFSNLNFEPPRNIIPLRIVWVGALIIGASIVRVIFPPNAYFWLSLLVIIPVGWVASYGWREAVRVLSVFLNRIQNL